MFTKIFIFPFLYVIAFFACVFNTTRSEQTTIDLCIHDYIASRYISDKPDHEGEREKISWLLYQMKLLYKDEKIFSHQTCKNLDIINSKKEDLCSILESELSLCTYSGKVALVLSLLHPITDIKHLQEKQTLIQLFMTHPGITYEFEKVLLTIKAEEDYLLTLLTTKSLNIKQLQRNFVGINKLLDQISFLADLAEQVPQIGTFTLFKKIQDLILFQLVFSDFRHFLHQSTFSAPTSLLCNWRTVSRAYQKYQALPKQLFAELCYCIGELDLALAAAKLMINNPEYYCFPIYIDQKNPSFSIKQNWHPLLLCHKKKEDITRNDFVFAQQIRNIIVTGPNTSGKTAIFSGFLAAIFFALTLSITPAHQCILTPFHQLHVICTQESKSKNGTSRFEDEVHQIKTLIEHLKRATHEQKCSFVLIDEIFTCTKPDDGERAVQEFLKSFLQHNFNSLMIMSTHYHGVTTITQQHQSCSNYKINIHRDPHGNMKRLFTISPGISTISTALDLLEKGSFLS